MVKMKWLRSWCGVGRLGGLCLVLALVAALILPAAVYAAKPDGATASGSEIRIATKTSYPSSPYNTPRKGKVPIGLSGQQFARITGSLGVLEAGKKRYAIVIGSNYEGSKAPGGQIPPLIPPFSVELNWAEADAQAITGLLGGFYGFNVIPLIGDSATRQNILNTIKQVQHLEKRGDEVVFYYSGHGAQRVQGNKGQGTRGWGAINEGIVTDEGNGQNVNFIWDDELQKAFQDFDTDRIVFIFDSCLSGGMTELAQNGRIVLMATTKAGLAGEDGPEGYGMGLNHGFFTGFLLGAFSGFYPEADAYDHDGNPLTPDVTVEEAYNFASASLIDLTPTIKSYIEYYFGPEIAALWGTPTIDDRFWKDLLF